MLQRLSVQLALWIVNMYSMQQRSIVCKYALLIDSGRGTPYDDDDDDNDDHSVIHSCIY